MIDDNNNILQQFSVELSDPYESAKNALISSGTIKPKPTNEEINETLKNTKECTLIEQKLGTDWTGCMWTDQDHPSSCNCPCVGSNFYKYIEYTRTYSTYWSTPNYTPLARFAQMRLINSYQAFALLNGDLSLRPGTIIRISDEKTIKDDTFGTGEHRHSGKWLVSSIVHTIKRQNHSMSVFLTRDSIPYDPNKSQNNPWIQKSIDGSAWGL